MNNRNNTSGPEEIIFQVVIPGCLLQLLKGLRKGQQEEAHHPLQQIVSTLVIPHRTFPGKVARCEGFLLKEFVHHLVVGELEAGPVCWRFDHSLDQIIYRKRVFFLDMCFMSMRKSLYMDVYIFSTYLNV